MPVTPAENSFNTAKELTITSRTFAQSLSDRIDTFNTNDYYRFTLNARSSISLSLTGLRANADLQILGADGCVHGTSSNGAAMADAISTDLTPGTYYIRVSAGNDAAETDYTLGFKAQALTPTTNLLWRNYSTGNNAYWLMGGTDNTTIGSVQGLSTVPTGGWQIENVADFNGDGQQDILWRDGSRGTVAFWFMNGNNILKTSTPYTASTNWQIAGVADFNEDSHPDILWRDSASGNNAVWFMGGKEGVERLSVVMLPSAPTVWQIAGVADFNHDGSPDLLWRNSSTGTNALWFMGTAQPNQLGRLHTVLSSTAALPSAPKNWQIEGITDFNNDQSPDLLWRDYGSGANATWFMGGNNSTTIASVHLLQSAPTIWKAIPFNVEPAAVEAAGNSFTAALQVGSLTSTATYNARLTSSNQSDYYRFDVSEVRNLKIALSNLTANANLYLYDHSGTLIQSSTNDGIGTEEIDRQLLAGTYYLQVTGGNFISTGYTVSLAATAPSSDISKYRFTYYYNGTDTQSDYYTGYFYAQAGLYNAGSFYNVFAQPNQSGKDGRYYISAASQEGNQTDVGKVYITSYYDVNTGITGPNVYLARTRTGGAAGTNYLGSESAFISNGFVDRTFGQDTEEANIWTYRYNFTYYYSGSATQPGDTYSGQVYQQEGFYTPNSTYDFTTTNTEAGSNGKYVIRDATLVKPGLSTPVGTVTVSSYYDSETGKTFTPVSVTSSAGLGSEEGYLTSTQTPAERFGRDLYEADSSAPAIPATVQLVVTNAGATEAGAPATFTLTRTGNLAAALTVRYTIAGSATNGVDYTQLPGSVTFAAGASTATIALRPIEDSLVEGNESVTLTLNPSTEYVIGSAATGTATIADNDKHTFHIQFDYRYDTNGWFTPARKAALESAASVWERIILDDFATTPVGTKVPYVVNPQTGEYLGTNTVYTTDTAIDDILIFVGARDMGGNTLGSSRTSGYYDTQIRYSGNDFEPWIGSISFDSSTNWFVDSTPNTAEDIPYNAADFISVATHEIAHILGFSSSLPAYKRWLVGDTFAGPNAKAKNGGNAIPLQTGSISHIRDGYQFGTSGETMMDPTLTYGTRKMPTALDVAILNDLGYSVNYDAVFQNVPPVV